LRAHTRGLGKSWKEGCTIKGEKRARGALGRGSRGHYAGSVEIAKEKLYAKSERKSRKDKTGRACGLIGIASHPRWEGGVKIHSGSGTERMFGSRIYASFRPLASNYLLLREKTSKRLRGRKNLEDSGGSGLGHN